MASDVFKGKGWEAKLAKLVIEKAKADLGDEWQGDDSEATSPSRSPIRRAGIFADDGLIVQFNPYEVAAYARGAVDGDDPWDQLTRSRDRQRAEICSY